MKPTYLLFLVAVALAAPVEPNRIKAVNSPSRGMDQSDMLDGVVGGINLKHKWQLEHLSKNGSFGKGFLGSGGPEGNRQMDMDAGVHVGGNSPLGSAPNGTHAGSLHKERRKVDCDKPVNNIPDWIIKFLDCGLGVRA